MNVSVSGTVAL